MKRKPSIELTIPYAEIARAMGLDRQRVWAWFQPGRRIPAERVIEVERITGVPRTHLRPDIYPKGAASLERVAS